MRKCANRTRDTTTNRTRQQTGRGTPQSRNTGAHLCLSFYEEAHSWFIKAAEDACLALDFQKAQMLALSQGETVQASRRSQASSKDCWPRPASQSTPQPQRCNTSFQEKHIHEYPDMVKNPHCPRPGRSVHHLTSTASPCPHPAEPHLNNSETCAP